MRVRRTIPLATLALVASAVVGVGAASGKPRSASIPPIENMPYKPEPATTLIPPQPDPAAVPKANPTGEYNAYDLNVFETIWFPERQPGDEDAKAPPGGAIQHGICPPSGCPNHLLEFDRFWMKTMRGLVAPLGGTVHRYRFYSPGSGTPPYVFAQPRGNSYNLQAIVPGSAHPEQMVVVSGHYDQTDSGPASAWDSAEGHATVIRIAKILTDYWRKTGTRPSVSVKFSAWSAEEAGTFGSRAYIRDNVLPFPNARVRAYFNLDPCAGAYPAYYRGIPGIRTPIVMQLANPEGRGAISPEVKEDFERFNEQAREVVGDVFNHLDDKLTDVPGSPEIFVSDEEAEKQGGDSQEDEVVTAVGGLRFFTSDYANFEAIGVPILNLFPDYFGPHRDNKPGRPDGIAILHSPNDNLRSLNALTGLDQSGHIASQGWYKGMEMCAHIHGWFMLQPNMGGAVPVTADPVAYFEVSGNPSKDSWNAIDNPIKAGQQIRFDASGSHAFADVERLRLVPETRLRFLWNFGDGSRAEGRTAEHVYRERGTYRTSLTVVAPGERSDTMTLLVTVA